MAMPARTLTYIPSVRARRLAKSLEDARRGAGLSQAAASRSLGWSQQKMSAIESCRNKPGVEDVELLLDLYGVVGSDRDTLMKLAREAERRNWWNEYSEVLQGTYVALEDAAKVIYEWEPLLVPGLLQTPEYAREILSNGLHEADPTEIDRRLQARMLRQTILTRQDSPYLHVVLDEAVLERPVGGPEVMRHQLRRIAIEAERSNVTIQVLPKATGTHPGLEGACILLRFDEPDEPDVAYCEGFFGAIYLESPPKVTRCSVALERLREAALSPADSVALIESAADR